MTIKDVKCMLAAFLKGKWSIDKGWPDPTCMNGRLTWAAFDTIGKQFIGVKPFMTAWFFVFDVS